MRRRIACGLEYAGASPFPRDCLQAAAVPQLCRVRRPPGKLNPRRVPCLAGRRCPHRGGGARPATPPAWRSSRPESRPAKRSPEQVDLKVAGAKPARLGPSLARTARHLRSLVLRISQEIPGSEGEIVLCGNLIPITHPNGYCGAVRDALDLAEKLSAKSDRFK